METTRLLGDILREILTREPDIEVVGELRNASELPAILDRTGADIVVFGLSDQDLPPLCDDVVRRHPNLRLLAVEDIGSHGFIYEMRPQKVELGELSPELVLEVVRGGG